MPRLRTLLALCFVAALAGCLEERVIRDNSVDAKFGRSMSPNAIIHATQGPNAGATSGWQSR